MPEFEHCLRCGQPLRSAYSREQGLGLQCSEQLTPTERRHLARTAAASQADLAILETLPAHLTLRDRWRLLRAAIRPHPVESGGPHA